MKVKACVTALLLAGAAALPVTGWGAEWTESRAVLEQAAADAWSAADVGGLDPLPAGFLGAMDLSGGISYHPMPWGGTEASGAPMPLGQLRVERDGLVQTADVLNLHIVSPEWDEMMEGLFQADGTVTAEGRQKILNVNHNLSNAGAMVSELVLQGIAWERERLEEPVPYSLFFVDLRGVEAFRRMDRQLPMVYTTGSRALVYVDGWILPQYVKAYLWKSGPAYHVVVLRTSDSEKEAAREAGDLLVRAALGLEQ